MKNYNSFFRSLLICLAFSLTFYDLYSQPSERKSEFQEASLVNKNLFLFKTLHFEKVVKKNVSRYNYASQIFTTKPEVLSSVVNIQANFRWNQISNKAHKVYVRASNDGLEWSKYYLLEDMLIDSLNQNSDATVINKYVSLWNEDFKYFQFKIKTKDHDLNPNAIEILVNNIEDDDYPSICNCPTLPYK